MLLSAPRAAQLVGVRANLPRGWQDLGAGLSSVASLPVVLGEPFKRTTEGAILGANNSRDKPRGFE